MTRHRTMLPPAPTGPVEPLHVPPAPVGGDIAATAVETVRPIARMRAAVSSMMRRLEGRR